MRTTITIGFGIGIGLALVLAQAPPQARADDQDQASRAFLHAYYTRLFRNGPARAVDDQAAEKFLGTYTYQSGKKGDEEIPKDHLTGKVRIAKDAISLLSDGGDEEFVIRYEITPGEGNKPTKIKMEITKAVMQDAVGARATGLIAKDGDTVRLIYDYQEGRSPEDFKPDDMMQHLFVLKAEKK